MSPRRPLTPLVHCLWGLAFAACAAPDARADEAPPPQDQQQGLHGLIGVGLAYGPTYSGAAERRTTGLLLPLVSYRNGDFEASTLGGLRYWAIDSKDWKLAALLGYNAGRDDHKTEGWTGVAGSDRLAGMGNLAGTAEAGVYVSYLGLGLPLNLDLRAAPHGQGHGGTHATFSSALPLYGQDGLQLSLNASLSLADQRYMQAFYGVTPQQATTSAFSAYRPGGGFYSAELGLSANYQLTQRWVALGSVGYRRLLGDAARSPLAERVGTPVLMLGAGYQF